MNAAQGEHRHLLRRNMDAISQKTTVSLGFVLTILGILGSIGAFGYNAVSATTAAQDARITTIEGAIYSMSGDVHTIKGQVDILVNDRDNRKRR